MLESAEVSFRPVCVLSGSSWGTKKRKEENDKTPATTLLVFSRDLFGDPKESKKRTKPQQQGKCPRKGGGLVMVVEMLPQLWFCKRTKYKCGCYESPLLGYGSQ